MSTDLIQPAPSLPVRRESEFLWTVRQFRKSPLGVVGLVVLLVLVAVALLAPVIAPQNPYDLTQIDLRDGRLPPGSLKLAPPAVQRVTVSIGETDTGRPPDIVVVLSPTAETNDRLVTELTVAPVTPVDDSATERTFVLTFHPESAAERIASIEISNLPRQASLSAGEKQRFRNLWTLTGREIQNIVLALPHPTGKKTDFRLKIIGSERAAIMTYWLGTDDQGRDLLSAILFGLRISIGVAVACVFISLVIGTFIGLAAAYFGGVVGAVTMRVVDLQLSFPTILIALILLAALGRGVFNVGLALVLVQWAFYARTARGVALAERGKEYVEAAQCLGLGGPRIMLGHILPNCLPPLIVIATVQIAHAVTLEATLSFLGLGLPVTKPSLGLLISNGFDYLLSGQPWISIFPGIALLVTVISVNLVGDELRDLLNPRLRR